MNTSTVGGAVELGRGEYTAFQVQGQVVIEASGFTPTPGYRVWLQMRPEDVFPPMYDLAWIHPDGPSLPVLAPFAVGTSFPSSDRVRSVTVVDADGSHEIAVEPVDTETVRGPIETANHFALASDDILVSYTVANIAGQPLLTHDRRSFMGKDVDVTDTAVGRLVTVTLEAVPDLRVTTFTLIVPTVRVHSGGTAHVRVLGITADRLSGIAGPPIGQGIHYRVAEFRGTARHILS